MTLPVAASTKSANSDLSFQTCPSDMEKLVDQVFKNVVRNLSSCPQIEGILSCKESKTHNKVSFFATEAGSSLKLSDKEKSHLQLLLGLSKEQSTMTIVEVLLSHLAKELKELKLKESLSFQRGKATKQPLAVSDKELLAKFFSTIRHHTSLQAIKNLSEALRKDITDSDALALLQKNNIQLISNRDFFLAPAQLALFLEEIKKDSSKFTLSGSLTLDILIKLVRSPYFKAFLFEYSCSAFAECPFTPSTISDTKGRLQLTHELIKSSYTFREEPFSTLWIEKCLQDIETYEKLAKSPAKEKQRLALEAKKIFSTYHDFSRNYQTTAKVIQEVVSHHLLKSDLTIEPGARNSCLTHLHLDANITLSEGCFSSCVDVTRLAIGSRTASVMRRSLLVLYYLSLLQEYQSRPLVSPRLAFLEEDLSTLSLRSPFFMDEADRKKLVAFWFKYYLGDKAFVHNDLVLRLHLLQKQLQKSRKEAACCDSTCKSIDEISQAIIKNESHINLFSLYADIEDKLVSSFKREEFINHTAVFKERLEAIVTRYQEAMQDPLVVQDLSNYITELLHPIIIDCLIYGDFREIKEGTSFPVEDILPKELVDLFFTLVKEEETKAETLTQAPITPTQEPPTSSTEPTQTSPMQERVVPLTPHPRPAPIKKAKELVAPASIKREELIKEVVEAKNLSRIAKLLNKLARQGLLPHERSEGRHQGTSHIQVHGITLPDHGRSAEIPKKTLKSIGEQLADAVERNAHKIEESL